MHYHDYEIVEDTDTAQVEICTECHDKLVVKKGSDGRVDNKKYLENHPRDFAQSEGRTSKLYKRFYGKKEAS
ncbi:MAG TPA: hypothetical protein ENI23_15930 [bacterium]|nr:hypothetical protein [bacterium]